jgi:hypothetical protein
MKQADPTIEEAIEGFGVLRKYLNPDDLGSSDEQASEVSTESLIHAMNIATATNASDARRMQQRLGEDFHARGSQAESWIQQPPNDMWTYEKGQLMIEQLGETTKPDEVKYYAALLAFKETMMQSRNHAKTFPVSEIICSGGL